jgi:RND family efflux transporter MFP subunit
MRKVLVIGLVVAAVGGAAAYVGLFGQGQDSSGQPGQTGQRGGGGGGFGGPGGGFGGGFRPPLTVEIGEVTTGTIGASLTVVGNLIGQQTVDVVPRTGGRLVTIGVQLGDRVRRGQILAKIEDQEIVEQVKQARASLEVAQATIRQREADLKVAELNFERSKNLYGRQLLAKQALDDAESRYMAAVAQLDLSKAQATQTSARLEELQINLGNTTITSPVDGFVSKRNLDPGAWISQQAPVVSVVEISSLRLVANVVEKDLRLVTVGDPAVVEVDAYPGEKFRGRIGRVAPVLDPATRTAAIEIEIPNGDMRLKPGMYARIVLDVEERTNATLVPKVAVVDYEGQRGVFMANAEKKAEFRPVSIGIEDPERAEIVDGLKPGDRIVVNGAAALRVGDTLVVAGEASADGPSGPGAGGPPGRPGPGAPRGKNGERPTGKQGQ